MKGDREDGIVQPWSSRPVARPLPRRFETGQRVRIDGTRGTIEVLKEGSRFDVSASKSD